jgi:hypothetical protein
MMSTGGNPAGTKNKTLKRTIDLSGDVISDVFRGASPSILVGVQDQQDTLSKFLDAEVGGAYKRQWHRLERGLRINRLRKFADEEARRLNLTDQERGHLFSLLMKSLEKKQLNSKTAVVYDLDQEKITEIKGLVMHRASDGQTLFQIVDKQKGVTFRRKKNTVTDE